MAREKTTIPETLNQAINQINQAMTDYNTAQDLFLEATEKGNYENAKKALDDGHACVLKLKDLHNGLYRFNKAPKVEKSEKSEKPATPEKNETEDIPPTGKGAMAKLHKSATAAQEEKAAAMAKPATRLKVKAKAK